MIPLVAGIAPSLVLWAIFWRKMAVNPARVSILGVSAIYALAALYFGLQSYHELMAKHAWTAATITIPMNGVATLFAAALGGAFGWSLFSKSRSKNQWAILLGSIMLTIYFPTKIFLGKRLESELESIRSRNLRMGDCMTLVEQYRKEDHSLEKIRSLAYNATCDATALGEISKAEDESTQAAVASNPNTPIEILVKMSTSPSMSTRYYLTFNPMLPLDVLKKIAETDTDQTVKGRASERLKSLTPPDPAQSNH